MIGNNFDSQTLVAFYYAGLRYYWFIPVFLPSLIAVIIPFIHRSRAKLILSLLPLIYVLAFAITHFVVIGDIAGTWSDMATALRDPYLEPNILTIVAVYLGTALGFLALRSNGRSRIEKSSPKKLLRD